MKQQLTRRQFIRTGTVGAAGLWFIGNSNSFGKGKSPNEKLNIGVIGTANRAGQNIKGIEGENIVAICDIDGKFLDAAKQRFPAASAYNDFRKLLEHKGMDAVVVSTADHTHAVATVAAMESGFDVYCEKPLTHTVSEARIVAATAKRLKRVTQMGNQIHATPHYRRVVEMVQSGMLGQIKEVHCWADHLWELKDRPVGQPVPQNLNYDAWLGPVAHTPYSPEYHPFNWRRWWSFGGGTLSDFCCHLMDLPYWALGLKYPTTIEAEGPEVHPHHVPPWLIVRYEYAGTATSPAVKMIWYSGGKRPPMELPQWGNGVLFIGTKGMLLTDYGKHVLLPEANFAGAKAPKPFIKNSIGHHAEWIRACKTGEPTTCHFGYGALITEAGLLGNVAYRVGKKLDWDAAAMKARNSPEADEFIQHHYRSGWRI